ncbi:hypothetical protein Godav_028853, partial [Gossypium davidsonii]|nr:hypothetical protein [Gossypium davidsonii]
SSAFDSDGSKSEEAYLPRQSARRVCRHTLQDGVVNGVRRKDCKLYKQSGLGIMSMELAEDVSPRIRKDSVLRKHASNKLGGEQRMSAPEAPRLRQNCGPSYELREKLFISSIRWFQPESLQCVTDHFWDSLLQVKAFSSLESLRCYSMSIDVSCFWDKRKLNLLVTAFPVLNVSDYCSNDRSVYNRTLTLLDNRFRVTNNFDLLILKLIPSFISCNPAYASAVNGSSMLEW